MIDGIARWLMNAGHEPMTDLELRFGQQRRPLPHLALLVEGPDSVAVVAGAPTPSEIADVYAEVQVLEAAMLSAGVTKDLRLLIVGSGPPPSPSHVLPPRVRFGYMVDDTDVAERLEELTASDPSALARRTGRWIDESLPPASEVTELGRDPTLSPLYEMLRRIVDRASEGDIVRALTPEIERLWNKVSEITPTDAFLSTDDENLTSVARARVQLALADEARDGGDGKVASPTASYRLTSLKVSNCRGFNQTQTISLDADIVLIFGRNGTGKSSVVDAIRLGLFGPQALASTLERGYYPPKAAVEDLAREPINRFSGRDTGEAIVELVSDSGQTETAGHSFGVQGWTGSHGDLGLSHNLFASANCFSQELLRDLVLEPRQRRYLRLLEVLNLGRAQSLYKALQYVMAPESLWSKRWASEDPGGELRQHDRIQVRHLLSELPFRVRGKPTVDLVRGALLDWLTEQAPQVDWGSCLARSVDQGSYRSLAQEVWAMSALADPERTPRNPVTPSDRLSDDAIAAAKLGLQMTKHVLKQMVHLERTKRIPLPSQQFRVAAHGVLIRSFGDLMDAWESAMARMVQERLERLTPTWHRLYRTLSPHDHFTDLTVHASKAGVWLCATDARVPDGEKAEMRLVLGEGQLNCAMISLLLAVYIHQGSPLRTLILDDPFVSLDDVRIEIFTSLIRGIVRAGTQVVVGTYDRRIYGSLKSLSGMQTGSHGKMLCLEIDDWTPTRGPVINAKSVDLKGGGDLSTVPGLSMRLCHEKAG
jgi:hypothetical protein